MATKEFVPAPHGTYARYKWGCAGRHTPKSESCELCRTANRLVCEDERKRKKDPTHVVRRDYFITDIRPRPEPEHGGFKIAIEERCPCEICAERREARKFDERLRKIGSKYRIKDLKSDDWVVRLRVERDIKEVLARSKSAQVLSFADYSRSPEGNRLWIEDKPIYALTAEEYQRERSADEMFVIRNHYPISGSVD